MERGKLECELGFMEPCFHWHPRLSDPSDVLENMFDLIGTERNDRFCGSMCVSISRSDLPRISEKDYMVCKKTDGVRYLMVVSGEGIFMVDRSHRVFPVRLNRIKESSILARGTVLDGELVEREPGDLRFLVFDCLASRGSPDVRSWNYSERLNELSMVLNEGYDRHSEDSFRVCVKSFEHSWDFDPERLEASDEGYDTDGYILTPSNDPVVMYHNPSMLKWKERHTVDLMLCADGQLRVGDMNVGRIEGKYPIGSILECYPKGDGWVCDRVRTDKKHPNSKRTFEATMRNVRERLGWEEVTGAFRMAKKW